MRLTVVGLGFIVAIAMLSHGWREFSATTQVDGGDLHAAAAVLVLAGAIMGFGALLTIWNPPGAFIVPGLAAVLAIIAGGNGIASAFAYGAMALLLCGLTLVDANRANHNAR